ncbi:MAG: FecR family protein [Bacteroidales bacterium]
MGNDIKWKDYSKIPLKHETFHKKEEIATVLMDKYYRSKQKKKRKRLFLRIAASVALFTGGIGITYFASERKIYSDMYLADHTLPDGSQVKIYPDSEIKYNTILWNFERKVAMKGSAEFDVVKAGTTFSVKTENVNIKVLGTIFTVTETGDITDISCKEGHVLVSNSIGAQDLKAGDTLSVSKDSYQLTTSSQETTISDMSSKSEPIILDAVPLKELVVQLEQIYSRKFIIEANRSEVRYSGPILQNDLEGTLQLISLSCNVQVKEDNGIYMLY